MDIKLLPEAALLDKKLHIKRRLFVLCELLKANDKVLDIGCGIGSYLTDVLGYLPIQLTAIDSDAKSIDYAKSHNKHKNIEYIIAEGELFKAEHNFDVIVCSHVLEHVKSPFGLLCNIYRLLEERGRLYLAIPNGYGCFEVENFIPRIIGKTRIGALLIKKMMSRQVKDSFNYDSPHLNYFTFSKIKRLLSSAGFRIGKHFNEQLLGGVVTDRTLLKIGLVEKFNLSIVDKLPKFMANGWILVCQKN